MQRETAYIARRSNGVFEIRSTVRRDGRSQTATQSLGTKDEREARERFELFFAQQDLTFAAIGSPLVSDLLLAYLSALEARGAGDTAKICVQHLLKGFEGVRLNQLSRERLQEYRNSRNVQSGTLRRELGALIAAINQAVKERKITLADVPSVELPRASQPRVHYLTESDEEDFYQRAIDTTPTGGRLTRIARYVAVALDCAARKEAILGLTWSRIHLDGANPYIDFREEGQQLHNKRRTTVPINTRLLPVLKRAKEEAQSEWFLDHNGSIRYAWDKFIETTPYKGTTPHDLRRTFASIAVSNGVPIEFVAEVLGDDPATTRKHYAFLDPRAKLTAVNHRWK